MKNDKRKIKFLDFIDKIIDKLDVFLQKILK